MTASAKDTQHPARSGLVRPGLTHSRTSSHSIIANSLNATHRVTRRKSMSSNGANRAAFVTILSETAEPFKSVPAATHARRHTVSKASAAKYILAGSLPAYTTDGLAAARLLDLHVKTEGHDASLDGNDIDVFPDAGEDRTGDGTAGRFGDGRKSNRAELRCNKCGKGYKHSSCLAKHLWEHTPGWSYTSKLLISKHQQVQLLEAASVLVAMNHSTSKDALTPPDSARESHSDAESYSPIASGYSDPHDRLSSAETTPPPQGDNRAAAASGSHGYPRSYQFVPPPSSFHAASVPNGSAFDYNCQAQSARPVSSGRNHTGQEDRDLAAAVELLSCSFGSSKEVRPLAPTVTTDAPPVPPFPARYLDEAASSWGGPVFFGSLPSRQPESFARGEACIKNVKIEENEIMMDEDGDDSRLRARSDEDDDGVFGRMEE